MHTVIAVKSFHFETYMLRMNTRSTVYSRPWIAFFWDCDSDLKLEKFPEAEFVAGSIGLGGVVGHFTDENVCAKLLHLFFHLNYTELSKLLYLMVQDLVDGGTRRKLVSGEGTILRPMANISRAQCKSIDKSTQTLPKAQRTRGLSSSCQSNVLRS